MLVLPLGMYDILKSKNLMYIEDEPTVLDNVSSILKSYFHTVYTGLNAEDGCDIFGSKKVDLILVDIELPGKSGIELIKNIREINKDIPIVIISAYTKTDYLLESIELKIEQYIVKPFTSKKLYALLEKLANIFTHTHKITLNQDIIIDVNNACVLYKDTQHNLTAKELEFLIIMEKNKVVTYDEINLIWDDFTPTPDAIRSFIKHLRKKLPENTLKNRQNLGYYV